VGADLEEAPEYVVNEEKGTPHLLPPLPRAMSVLLPHSTRRLPFPVFDGIVRLCFGHLRDAFHSLLVAMKQEGEREGGDHESQSIVFHRLKKHTALVKQYLQALLYVRSCN
jgi:hypothetical protein